MATGYTHRVEDGEVTELRDFALICAAAFLVRMRDSDSRIPPERFEPSAHYRDQVQKAESELKRLLEMNEVDIQEAAEAYNRGELRAWEDYRDHMEEALARHDAMLEQVEAWEPPTPTHAELKKFMRSQLTMSRKPLEDGPPPRPIELAPERWHALEVEAASHHLEHARDLWAKEQERTEDANRWLAELRASLEPEEEAAHV